MRPFAVVLSVVALSSALLNARDAFARARDHSAAVETGAWDDRPVRLPPVFWYEREDSRRMLMAAMLYWDWSGRRSLHRLLLPVFYHRREGDERLFVSLPFIAHYRGPDARWLLLGPYYSSERSGRSRRLFVPLYWRTGRPEGGRTVTALPFVFYHHRNAGGTRQDTVSLLGVTRRRGPLSTGRLLNYWWTLENGAGHRILFPLYWNLSSKDDRSAAFGPFYARKKNLRVRVDGHIREDVRRWAGLFPVAGAGWGRGFGSFYLSPVAYWSRTPDSRTLATLPFSRSVRGDHRSGHAALFYYSLDPDRAVRGVFPLWHDLRSSDGFERTFRLATYLRKKEGAESFSTLFPLYAHWSTSESSQWMSWLFWSHKRPGVSSGWSLLYFWSSAPDRSTRVFFPLAWSLRRPSQWEFDLFVPFYGRYRHGDTRVTAVFPFVRKVENGRSTTSLFFLWWRDRQDARRSTTLVPLFHWSSAERRTLFISPVVWRRRSAASGEGIVPPVYWYRSGEVRRTFVVPFYWSHAASGRSTRIIPPYYRIERASGTALGLFPLWGRHQGTGGRGLYVLPFYFHARGAEGDSIWIVPPALAFASRSGEGTERYRFEMQYLLFGSVQRSTHAFAHDFFPVYRYVRSDLGVNVWSPRILPLFALEKEKNRTFRYVFPYAGTRSVARDWDLFFPLLYRSSTYDLKDPDAEEAERGRLSRSFASVFPVYWRSASPSGRALVVAPVFGAFSSSHTKTSVVLPLWWAHRRSAESAFKLLFPVYWHAAWRNKDSDIGETGVERRTIRVLGPWYRTVSYLKAGGRRRTVGVAPLYAVTRGPDSDRSFEILGGLFARDARRDRVRYRFFWVFDAGGRSDVTRPAGARRGAKTPARQPPRRAPAE